MLVYLALITLEGLPSNPQGDLQYEDAQASLAAR